MSTLSTDPFYSAGAVVDFSDPFLQNVTDMKSYVGRPRMNIDMSEKETHYCVCVGKRLYYRVCTMCYYDEVLSYFVLW
jgi:hypothetical protein